MVETGKKPYMLLEVGQGEVVAGCGCVLERDPLNRVRFYMCDMHTGIDSRPSEGLLKTIEIRCRTCDRFPCTKSRDPNRGCCGFTPSRHPLDVRQVHAQRDALLAMTAQLEEHPEGYEGPCACRRCCSYGD